MIGSLTGKAIGFLDDNATVIIDVNGVGYRVTVVSSLFQKLAGNEDKITLFIHTRVREDAIALYGFENLRELKTFEVLVATHGVGPSLGLSLLSTLGSDEFWRSIRDEQVKILQSVPGVGAKTAQRLIVELREKAQIVSIDQGAGKSTLRPILSGKVAVKQALVELGYGSDEIREVLSGLEDTSDESLLLKLALRSLSGIREVSR